MRWLSKNVLIAIFFFIDVLFVEQNIQKMVARTHVTNDMTILRHKCRKLGWTFAFVFKLYYWKKSEPDEKSAEMVIRSLESRDWNHRNSLWETTSRPFGGQLGKGKMMSKWHRHSPFFSKLEPKQNLGQWDLYNGVKWSLGHDKKLNWLPNDVITLQGTPLALPQWGKQRG